MSPHQPEFNDTPTSQNQDYEAWMNSLGNIQDGVFQNTPLSHHIVNQQHQQGYTQLSIQQSNTPLHFVGSTPLIQHQMSLNPLGLGGTGTTPDASNAFFDSPDRFYRDVIDESPIVNKTPHMINFGSGRTPMKGMGSTFNTPLFLRTMDSSNNNNSNCAGLNIKSNNMTPLKNQIFNINNAGTPSFEMFQTPNERIQNSTLNSSPTTIKINSSAVKVQGDDAADGSKILQISPTPISKIPQKSPVTSNSVPATVPKMGFFKKASPVREKSKVKKQPPAPSQTLIYPQTNGQTNGQQKFQIIMSDYNTFGATKPKTKKKKKALMRSSTQINAPGSSNGKGNNISKKQPLKRSASQPAAVLAVKSKDTTKPKEALVSVLQPSFTPQSELKLHRGSSNANTPLQFPKQLPTPASHQQHSNIRVSPLREQPLHERNIQPRENTQIKFSQIPNSNGPSYIEVEDLFSQRAITDQENLGNW